MMKKRILLFVLIGIMSFSVLVNAENIVKTIEVAVNPFRICINGQELTTEHFVYNDTTYVPLRAVSEGLDVNVKWDAVSNTVNISKKETVKPNSEYPEYISLINLIATPEKYHGKYIDVKGYYL